MREVSSKMNLTDCANPNYEDAVSVVSRIHTVYNVIVTYMYYHTLYII